MKTENARSKFPEDDGGGGPIGDRYRSNIFEQIAERLEELSKLFDKLAHAPVFSPGSEQKMGRQQEALEVNKIHDDPDDSVVGK